MSLRMLYATALIVIAVGSSVGQVVTRTTLLEAEALRTGMTSFVIDERYPRAGKSPDALDNRLRYAIEDELVVSGFLPALRTRPAGLLVTFYIESQWGSGPDDGDVPQDGPLVVECRDGQTDHLVWRGVATAVTELTATDPHEWESRLMKAARMLVRKFEEETRAN